jgi:retron-type reverse transcriptase
MGKKYVVFVDYSKVFDTVNCTILLEKLKKIIGNTWVLKLISNILVENNIQVYDNTAKSDWISQKNGVLQGEPLSPHLFNVLTYDIIEKINKKVQNVMVYMYADSMALALSNREEIQKTTDALIEWADENELQVSQNKSELVVSCKGGRRLQMMKYIAGDSHSGRRICTNTWDSQSR